MAAETSSSNSSAIRLTSVSNRSWFLTFAPENGDVFIWKNQCRLKVAGQQSAGRVLDVSVERLVMVSY